MGSSTALAGIIANPVSGRDIRRLVAYGTTMDSATKVRTLQRVLVGLREAGVRQVLYMPDPADFVPVAFDGLRPADRDGLLLEPTLERIRGDEGDTALAAAAMVRRGAGVIVTLGGDGTNRLVAAEAGAVPLMPLSTGTNNAFPTWVEPTIAGLAAGLVAMRGDTAGCRREKLLRVTTRAGTAIALVDVALLHGTYAGTGAIWDATALRELAASQASLCAIGLSAVAARATPVDRAAPAGLYLKLDATGQGRPMRAPIAPGVFATLHVAGVRRLAPGEPVLLGPGPGILALDGERLHTLGAGEHATVELVLEGPWVVDPELVLGSWAFVPEVGTGPGRHP